MRRRDAVGLRVTLCKVRGTHGGSGDADEETPGAPAWPPLLHALLIFFLERRLKVSAQFLLLLKV